MKLNIQQHLSPESLFYLRLIVQRGNYFHLTV